MLYATEESTGSNMLGTKKCKQNMLQLSYDNPTKALTCPSFQRSMYVTQHNLLPENCGMLIS